LGPLVHDMAKDPKWMEGMLKDLFMVSRGIDEVVGSDFGKGILWGLLYALYYDKIHELDNDEDV